MNADLMLTLWADDNSFNVRLRKRVRLAAMPIPGTLIEDAAWKHPRPVQNVLLSTSDPSTISVMFENEILPDEYGVRGIALSHREHDWTARVPLGTKEIE